MQRFIILKCRKLQSPVPPLCFEGERNRLLEKINRPGLTSLIRITGKGNFQRLLLLLLILSTDYYYATSRRGYSRHRDPGQLMDLFWSPAATAGEGFLFLPRRTTGKQLSREKPFAIIIHRIWQKQQKCNCCRAASLM